MRSLGIAFLDQPITRGSFRRIRGPSPKLAITAFPQSIPMLRILTLTYEYPPIGGGGSKVAAGLAEGLVEAGHQVDILTMGFRGVPPTLERDRLGVTRLGGYRRRIDHCTTPELLRHTAAALRESIRRVRVERYDIAHTHFLFPDGVVSSILARLNGLPFVVTAHGSDVPDFNPDRFRLEHRLFAPAWRTVVRSASAIISPSRYLEGLIRKRAPDAPTQVIPNGIDLAKFQPATHKEPGRVLVVTRMLRRKGVQDVLRALAQGSIRTQVDIVGDGPFLPELRKLAGALGVGVNFHGWLDHGDPKLQFLYEQASVFCFPSYSENFPVSLLEAMVAGNAIITSNRDGCREVVDSAGILVEPGNVREIAAALKRLLGDQEECRRFGAAARKRAETEFGWPAVTRRYEEVLYHHARNQPSSES